MRFVYCWTALLVLIFSLGAPAVAQQPTAFADADCGKPIDEYLGVPARSNASHTTTHANCGELPPSPTHEYQTTSIDGEPFQCPEYIRRFYRSAIHMDTSSWTTHAAAFYDNAAAFGLRAIPNGSTDGPQQSDILVFGPTARNSAGHIAVVTDVTPTRITIIEQNWLRDRGISPNIRRRESEPGWNLYRVLNSGDESDYRVVGWLRKPPASPPPPPSNIVTFVASGIVEGISGATNVFPFTQPYGLSTPVTAAITFDKTTPDRLVAYDAPYHYAGDYAPTSIIVTVGNNAPVTFTPEQVGGAYSIGITSGVPPSPYAASEFLVYASHGSGSPIFSLILGSGPPAYFATDALPIVPPDITQFAFRASALSFCSERVNGICSSIGIQLSSLTLQ